MDLSAKLENSEGNISRGHLGFQSDGDSKGKEDKLAKAEKDSSKITIECIHGLMSQVLKAALFNKKINNTN